MKQQNAGLAGAAAWLRAVTALMLVLAIAGCGLFGGEKKPEPKEVAMKPPPQATLLVTVAASPLINPDLDGRPSPVTVRLYQLGSEEAFTQADFGSLYEHDDKALGKSLLGQIEEIMEPGGIKALSVKKLNPDTVFIGVVVGFRKYKDAQWRAIYAMQGKDDTRLRCNITRLAVELKEEE